MSLDILKNRIKENNMSGVFLFYGPEEYTKDHYASRIRKKVDASPIPEFNHIYFNASSDKICDLEDAVNSLPYMWESKLIEITDLESAKFSDSDIEDYARIFSDIPDYLTILIVARIDSFSSKEKKKESEDEESDTPKSGLSAFYYTVKEHGLAVEFNTEKADKLITWITRHFTAKNVTFEANVPREIINVCGNDMYILQGEIAKLTEVYSGKPLKASDVRKYCCVNSDYKYFDIATVLNRKDLVTAKRIWDSLDLSRDEIPLAMGFLVNNYSRMLYAKIAIDSGKGHDTIGKDLKINQSWLVNKIVSASSAVDMKTLSFAITQLSNADIKIKNYRGNPKRILELVFYRICTYGRKA